ncbi:hypothetical protein EZS27_034696, partial [termite gut metagenome]
MFYIYLCFHLFLSVQHSISYWRSHEQGRYGTEDNAKYHGKGKATNGIATKRKDTNQHYQGTQRRV